MIDWVLVFFTTYETHIFWLSVGSTMVFVLSILSLPWLLSIIPVDYFNRTPNSLFTNAESISLIIFQLVLLTVRSIAGLGLVLLGILMLFLPGQGILTILAGIFLMDFPAKFRFECWLVMQPKVLNSINWFRAKNNKPPVKAPKKTA